MKKFFLIFLLLLCFSFLYSQLINSYGIKTGVSITNQDYDFTYFDGFETNSRIGLDIGGFTEFAISKRFNFLLETHFVQKGSDVEINVMNDEGLLIDNEASIIVNYLEFNLFSKFIISQTEIKPYVIIGPKIEVLIGYKNEWGVFEYYYDDYESIDYFIGMGLGVEFQLFKGISSLLEFRFSPSSISSYKTDIIEISNRSYEVLTGIKF